MKISNKYKGSGPMKTMEKVDKMGIKALLPIYGELGENQTLIYTLEGETILCLQTMRSFLQAFFRYQGLDLYQLRKKYGQLLQRRNGIPVPLGPYIVLVPAKVRQPVGKGDGAYGYVSFDQVEKVEEKGRQGIFHLTGDVLISTLWSPRILHQQLLYARLVQQNYEEEQKRKYNLYGVSSKEAWKVQEPMILLFPMNQQEKKR